MTDAPELKPCPFCGSKAANPWFDDNDNGSGRGEVYCTGCSATAQGSYQGWMRGEDDMQQSINQAVTAWNRRVDIPATDAQAFANEKVKALADITMELHDIAMEAVGQKRSHLWPRIRKARAALAAMKK